MPTNVTTQEDVEILPMRWIRVVIWPANFREAVFATIFALAVLAVGFLNPWAIPFWTLFTGDYNPFMLGIYVWSLQLAAILFGANLGLFACGKYLRSAIVVPQLIQFALLLACLVLGITATYECSWSHGLGGCYY